MQAAYAAPRPTMTPASAMSGSALPAGTVHAAMQAFIEVLEREQRALAHPASADVQAFADERLRLADQIEALRRKTPRNAAVDPAAVDPELAALARRARRLNETNGRLIALHLQSVTARLQALETRERPVDALYQANGRTLGYR